ncbi:MAG: intein-containing Rv2578c family radical SAM protein [Actinopolymorphaceae bacterium]
MRWDNLAVGGAEPLPLALPGAVTRTFDTPGFAGMTFYEIRARSVINRVPGRSRVPFEWTINPYRGCSHACTYCLAGETPVLMADGRTKALADLRIGEAICGTVFDGKYRRFVATQVLDHWSTVKPAYRVRLEDGTELVASGDHRFLTDRGWKHVTGAEQGRQRRPFLTLNNMLIGTGRFAVRPEGGLDYRLGYLCGMIRGDGHLGAYSYRRLGRQSGDVHRFRLALCDVEPLQRVRQYLAQLGIETTEFVFQNAVGGRQQMRAIRASARSTVARIQNLIAWPKAPSDEWAKGFLAGIFDAEGSRPQGGVLRISNTDQSIIDQITSCLRRFGFRFVIEEARHNREKPVTVVRMLGGLCEHLRFFHTVDPVITRKRTVDGAAIKNHAPLRVVSIEPLGLELPLYDMTTGTGDYIANGIVSHNCFARNTHTYLDLDAGRDFDTKVIVKVNAGELVRRELAAPKWRGDHIAMGTNVDCYQRAEGRYQLMPRIIGALRDFRNPFSILTKGTLILRDLPLLREAAEVTAVGLSFSVGFVDDALWRSVEPGTPSPRRRLDAVRTLTDAGFTVGVLMAPILPFLTDTDESVDATVAAIAESGAASVTPLLLHLRPGAREWYAAWLDHAFPDLAPRYRALYRRGSYLPKTYQHDVTERVKQAARRYGMDKADSNRARQVPASPTEARALGTSPQQPPVMAEPEQLSLL